MVLLPDTNLHAARTVKDMERLLRIAPDTTLDQVSAVFSIKDAEVEERWLEGLRLAGMPE